MTETDQVFHRYCAASEQASESVADALKMMSADQKEVVRKTIHRMTEDKENELVVVVGQLAAYGLNSALATLVRRRLDKET